MNDTSNEDTGDVSDDWGAALSEQSEAEASQAAAETAEVKTEAVPETQKEVYEKANFQELHDETLAEASLGETNLDMILDIPVTLSVEIGRTSISISNLLKLNQGSVVELDQLAGEPMDVMVNGTLIAHGEIVVVNEKFGIRLTDVVSAVERVKNLK